MSPALPMADFSSTVLNYFVNHQIQKTVSYLVISKAAVRTAPKRSVFVETSTSKIKRINQPKSAEIPNVQKLLYFGGSR